MLNALRQWLQPPEFRLDRPTSSAELLDELERLIEALAIDETTAPVRSEAELVLDRAALGDLATLLLRLREQLAAGGDESPRLRRARRHGEALWELVERAGVQIVDHTNEPYAPGLRLIVRSVQPTPGVERETISETARPTVLLHGQVVHIGEVHVAAPDDGPAATS